MPKKGEAEAPEGEGGSNPREDSVVRKVAELQGDLADVGQFLFNVPAPAPIFPLWDQALFDPPATDAEDAEPKVKWGSETEKYVDFSVGTPVLPTEDQEAEGVVVEWKRVSEPSILNSAYWKNSLPITKGEPVVNPEETSAQPQTTEVPSDSTEPVGPLTVVRKPEAAPVPEPAEGEENSDEAPPSPSMPRRIITPLNSTFSEDEENAAPVLIGQAAVLESVFVMVSAISKLAVEKADRVLKDEEEAALALKAEQEKENENENVPPENEEETEEELAEKAAAEEAKRVRRLAMIAEADMIPKGAFLWEAIYPKSEDGVTPRFNPGGRYCVRLFVNGAWRRIDVDDRVPLLASNGSPVLCRSSDKAELWPLILSKALVTVVQGRWEQYDALKLLHHLTGLVAIPTDINSNDNGWPLLMHDVPHTKIQYDDDAGESPRSPRFFDDDGEMEAAMEAEKAAEEAAMGLEPAEEAATEEPVEESPKDIRPGAIYIIMGRSRDTVLDFDDNIVVDEDVAIPVDEEKRCPTLRARCAAVVMETRGGDDDTNIAALVSDDPEIAAAAAAALAKAAEDDDEEDNSDDREVRMATTVKDAENFESGWMNINRIKKEFSKRTYSLIDPNNSKFFSNQVVCEKHWGWTWVDEAVETGEAEEDPVADEEADESTVVVNLIPEKAGKWMPAKTEWKGPQFLYFPGKESAETEEESPPSEEVPAEQETKAPNENPYLSVWVTLSADLSPVDVKKSTLTIRSCSLGEDGLMVVSDSVLFTLSTTNVGSGSFPILFPGDRETPQIFAIEMDTIGGVHVTFSSKQTVRVLGYSELFRDVYKHNVTEISGRTKNTHPEQWSVLSRTSFKVSEEDTTSLSCNLLCKNPFLQRFVSLYILDCDTKKITKCPLLSFSNRRLEPNSAGYTVFAICQSLGTPLPALAWEMYFVSNRELLEFTEMPVGSTQDFLGSYIPNKFFRLMRDVIEIVEPDESDTNPRGSLRLTLSDPNAYAILRVINPTTKATVAEKSGRGNVILLDVPLTTEVEEGADDEDPNQIYKGKIIVESVLNTHFFQVSDDLKSRRPYHYPTGQPGDNSPADFTFNLRSISKSTLALSRDRTEENKLLAIRNGWEEAQPGRAEMARSNREYYLQQKAASKQEENGEEKEEVPEVDGFAGLEEEQRELEQSRRERVKNAVRGREKYSVPVIRDVPKSAPTTIFDEEFEKNVVAKWMEQEKRAGETVAAMQQAIKSRLENFEQRKSDRLEKLRQQHLEAMERLQVTYRNRVESEGNGEEAPAEE
jgi:hypothetical protein